ncbi:tetratricopeptide repeat protein [Aerosakkonemataceae cyanobacterium BLCC-F154]|uniref:Tetratricopeptide repeat protein n=1 Tax=Floridaenema fluviatile BLCC-F154 TaxID=3153640 RepID=A0ABV4Y7W8_9CYAN
MSEKHKSIHLLLITVLCFGFAAFGCSSSPSNSTNTTNGTSTQQPTTSAATTPVPSTVPAAENTPSTIQASPATSNATSALESLAGISQPSNPTNIGQSTIGQSTNIEQPTTTAATPAPGSAADWYQKGIASVQQGDVKSAEEFWRKSIELDPKNPEVHANLGVLLQRQGKLEEASSQYREALRLKSDDVETVMKLAMALGQQKKFDESIAQSQTAIRLKPDLAPAHMILAAALSEQGKPDLAIESLKKAQDLWKKQGQTEQAAGVQVQLASLLGKQGKFDEASTQIKQAIAIKPDFAPAHILLAEVALQQNRPQEAITSLQKARDLFKKQKQNDQLAATQMQLAMVLGRQKKYTEASAQAKEVLKLKPDFAPAYLILAEVATVQGNNSEAIANLRKAKDLFKAKGQTDPQLDTQLKLAFALGKEKKIDEAIALSRDAINLKPDFAPSHYVLAIGLAEKGQKNEAIASLQKAKELFTSQGKTQEAQRIEMMLQQLSGKL